MITAGRDDLTTKTARAPSGGRVQPLDGPRQITGVCFLDEHVECSPSDKSAMPCVDEAIVLTEVEVITREHTFSRPRDPLIVAGRGADGAKIRIYNADIQGWPLVGEAVAKDGKWHVEVNDESLFARGDRVVVTAQEQGKKPSDGVLQATAPFTERTYIREHYHDGQLRSRTTTGVSTSMDNRNADDRPPYYDEARVDAASRIDRGGIRLDLRGVCRAVPPHSTLYLG